MSWTAPMTFSSGAVLTAAQLNTHLRDNLLETAPAKATTAGRIFVATGANAIAERAILNDTVATTQTSTSTSYTDLATTGPDVTLTTGVRAIVSVISGMSNNTSGQNVYMSYAVSGATTTAATDDRSAFLTAAAANQGLRATGTYMETALTGGSNTFTCKYRVTGNTGSWGNRQIIAIGL